MAVGIVSVMAKHCISDGLVFLIRHTHTRDQIDAPPDSQKNYLANHPEHHSIYRICIN
jgi:hypothetical protein